MSQYISLMKGLGMFAVCFLFAGLAASAQKEVKLEHFIAAKDGCGTHLDWNATGGADVKNIQIERSSNGGAFMPIGIVTSTGDGHYAYSEDGLGTGRYEYRLKFNGRDGKYLISQIVVVSLVCAGDIKVYPVHTKDTVYITGATAGAVVNVYDSAGRGVLKTDVAGQTTKLSLRALPSGTYFIGVISNNELVKQETVVKDR